VATDLLSLLRGAGERLGDAPFLEIAGERASGGAFAQRVEATARGLLAAGLRHGDRVAVHVHRCLDEATAILAIAAAGGIAVPVNGKLKDAQVRHVLADAEPFGVVASALRALSLHDPAAVYAGHRLWRSGAAELPVASAPFAALAVAPGPGPALAPPAPDAPAALLYTSGTTGLQKGIVQDHRNLALGAEIVAGYLGLSATDCVLALLPFSFDYGLNQLLSALHAGCRVVAADHLGTGELGELLASVRPTGLAGVPSLWHEVAQGLRSGVLGADHGRSLRYVTNSGGCLRPDDSAVLRRHWPHVRVFAMYGLTEAFRSAFLDPTEFDRFPDSFGRALPGVELVLVDPETGRVLEGPATGELVHCGALVARGYWRKPAETAQRFRPDPRGRTGVAVWSGDLVRRDAEGRHWFVARRDRMLKVHGHRVSPDEVAAALVGLDGAGEVAVFGVDGGAQGHRIVLVVAGDPGDRELALRVARQCRARLPAYMVPAVVRVVPALPHNSNGKVDLPALEATMRACIDAT
jgi:acyl-CoA synthetase (AMP-forming)/AMP-acid ligase II